jgi:hypothetical protein
MSEQIHDRAYYIAKTACDLFAEVQRDWADGKDVRISDIQPLIEHMVRNGLSIFEQKVREKVRDEFFVGPLGAAQKELFGFKVGGK